VLIVIGYTAATLWRDSRRAAEPGLVVRVRQGEAG
jgi:hypothetical protein